ncbi:helix-turn-helix domain-containing protein [Thomasclavelia cocleata]|uniref:HTH cro/C1-type domain-containing protein n=1 Tax=Thomasclavelia cocleata TaxID=69824 RepID=A0A829Z9K3_9FIRM|nr:helix-turn-helix transcriptional regulator [Thomasclavelia cocleata]GFI40108.1 hypothetical protein IMSAGC017_00139 [Thomasclavelia cocleata]
MNDIYHDRAKCWCSRLSKLMKERNYTQKTFLKEYKEKYGGGTQANISRWLRVGSKIENGKTIGFPTYETMLNLADFFDVSVGYLTGETDYELFEMEKACEFLGLEEDGVKAIKGITSGDSVDFFGKHMADEYKSVLRYILTASSFTDFIKEAKEYVENVYRQKHPISHMHRAAAKIEKDVLELAYQCMDYQCISDDKHGVIDDFKENNVEPTEELLEAIKLLNVAQDYDYDEEQSREQRVKLSEYELQKIYFEIIKELVKEEHLPDMTILMYDMEQ